MNVHNILRVEQVNHPPISAIELQPTSDPTKPGQLDLNLFVDLTGCPEKEIYWKIVDPIINVFRVLLPGTGVVCYHDNVIGLHYCDSTQGESERLHKEFPISRWYVDDLKDKGIINTAQVAVKALAQKGFIGPEQVEKITSFISQYDAVSRSQPTQVRTT